MLRTRRRRIYRPFPFWRCTKNRKTGCAFPRRSPAGWYRRCSRPVRFPCAPARRYKSARAVPAPDIGCPARLAFLKAGGLFWWSKIAPIERHPPAISIPAARTAASKASSRRLRRAYIRSPSPHAAVRPGRCKRCAGHMDSPHVPKAPKALAS